MKSTVFIRTLFSTSSERTIDNLALYYQDRGKLYRILSDLVLPILGEENIAGKKILLKPNFVRENKSRYDDVCLITNPNLVLETVHLMLEKGAKEVVVGDAPIQDCHWDEMLPSSFYEEINVLASRYNVPVSVRDFRKVVFYNATNEFGVSNRTESDYLIFDTEDRSMLEPVTKRKNYFRVTNYDPDRMSLSHAPGKHQYCVAKEVFEADTVITMPKMKTHRMAALTNSLKILVGINGDKDYLPHHRIGAKSFGGDCYKDFSLLRTMAEIVSDFANRHRGSINFKRICHVRDYLWELSKPNAYEVVNAGWYGNDTVWRMVMDLNLIAQFGKLDGTLSDMPQRTMWTLCDGIVAGQGNGPLEPDPFALGCLAFSNDPYLMDEVAGHLFNMNLENIPLLKAAAHFNENKEIEILINGIDSSIIDVRKIGLKADMPSGWVGYDKL